MADHRTARGEKSTAQNNGHTPTPGYTGKHRPTPDVPRGVFGLKQGNRNPTDKTGGRYGR